MTVHKVSQRIEDDVEGPYEVDSLELDSLWHQVKKHAAGQRSRKRGHEPLLAHGGATFFLSGSYHALLVMPVGSDLHRTNAPPSHFAAGGPLEGMDP